jgi:sugar phosphate isomerase/epimerase
MQDILQRVHVHMPYDLLPEYQKLILREKMNLEIYFSHWSLHGLDLVKCRERAALLVDAGINITFHAPFMDLRPGALDEKIRGASLERLKQVFKIAPYFHPLRIVCHASFDHRYYVSCDEEWLENSVTTWRELLDLAREVQTSIALENVYERDPYILRRLFDLLSSDRICFCFDTGHFNVFSRTPLAVWFEELGSYLGHLHLHDNLGRTDEHLPVGCGNFPFGVFFQALLGIKRQLLITLEAHAPDDLWQSIENIKQMGFLRIGS